MTTTTTTMMMMMTMTMTMPMPVEMEMVIMTALEAAARPLRTPFGRDNSSTGGA
jgi:hypothetical protein